MTDILTQERPGAVATSGQAGASHDCIGRGSIFTTSSRVSHVENDRYNHLVFPDRVHRSVYTDPAIFAEEMVKIFAGSWVYLAHESELPKPNDFKTTKLGLRPLIVSRSGDGVIVAMFNRCAHRAALIRRESEGNARTHTCPYHGWTYGSSGDLIGVPHVDGYAESFDKRDRHLGRLPRVDSYRGFIFGSLNPDVPDLLKWLGPAAHFIDQWLDREGPAGSGKIELRRGASHFSIDSNWKALTDNFADGYHVGVAHRSCTTMTTSRHGPNHSLTHFRGDSPIMIYDLGNGHRAIDQRAAMGSRWFRQRPFPGKESYAEILSARIGPEAARRELEYAAYSGLNVTIYPNLLLHLNDVTVVEPVNVNRTDWHWQLAVPKGASPELISLRARIGEDMSSVCSPDDVDMAMRCTDGLGIPEMEWYDIGRGLGTERESRSSTEHGSVVSGNFNDDTGIRSAWLEWRRLMTSAVTLQVV